MSSRPSGEHPLARYGRGIWVVVPSLVFGFFTWLSFLILGLRARRRDWILTAGAYGVYSALVFFALSRPEIDTDDTANTLLAAAIAVAWFGGALHTGFVYYAFNRSGHQLDATPAGWPAPTRRNRRGGAGTRPAAPAGNDLGLGLGDPAAEYLASSEPPTNLPPGPPLLPAPVEANTASQRTLSRLPGMTPDRARRLVAERQRRGGFRDLDELAVALELQPHEIVRLRPRLAFTAPGNRRRRLGRGRGRVLDV